MKKVLVLIGIVASFVMVGCGEAASGADVTAGGKNSLAPEAPPAEVQEKVNKGLADDKAVAAPPGVKTGTPGA